MKLYDSYYKEIIRQRNSIELIASENFVSKDVLKALGTILTNKYAEGYPGKRYYGGCEFVDEIETETIELTKKLFNCKFANVQPHSGSQANQGVYAALLNPGDRILGMSLDCGGHLTHGSKVSSSGILYESYSYGVNSDGYIDYDDIERIALEVKPKLIVCGASAYARLLDFAKFRKIADKVGAYLMADIAHIAGLVVAGLHPSPIGIADVVTSTTHKTLRGPRGGIIMTNDEEISKKINKAIFPGIQGGPLMNVIFAKGIAFAEALNPNYKEYMEQVVKNIKALASTLIARGFKLVSGGTDNHLLLMDFSDFNFSGKDAQLKLEEIGITANKNSVPNEKRSPFITSGLRIGSPAMTTRGFKENEFNTLGEIIADCLLDLDTKANLKCRVNLLMQPFERTLNV